MSNPSNINKVVRLDATTGAATPVAFTSGTIECSHAVIIKTASGINAIVSQYNNNGDNVFTFNSSYASTGAYSFRTYNTTPMTIIADHPTGGNALVSSGNIPAAV